MKRLIIITFYFGIFSGLAGATSDGPDFWKVENVKSDDVLNVRLKPTYKSKLVGTVPHDARCLQNLQCVGGLTLSEFTDLPEDEKERIKKTRPRWCQIKYKQLEGWVSARYLRMDESDSCYK